MKIDVESLDGRYRGSARLRPEDFGITPVTVAGGSIRVKNEVRVEFEIIGKRTEVDAAKGVKPAFAVLEEADPAVERARLRAASGRTSSVHGIMVNTTGFESLPVHPITKVFPMAPETDVVFPLGGLNTSTSTDPGVAISAAVIAATNW